MILIIDKLKEHVEDKCKKCNKKNCEEIRITYNKQTYRLYEI